MSSSMSYCADLLRAHDRDRYLVTLLAPVPLRKPLCAIYALNLELSVIADTVSEELLGLMRLAWWRESLQEIASGRPPRQHPVLQALAESGAASLPSGPLARILSAREANLRPCLAQDFPTLEQYAADTAGSLMQLALSLASDNPRDQSAANAIGAAQGLLGTARLLPHMAHRGRAPLPDDLLADYGFNMDDLAKSIATPGPAALVRELASRANRYVTDYRQIEKSPAAQSLLKPVQLVVQHDLDRLRACNYSILHPDLEKGRMALHLRLWTQSWKKII